MQATELLNFKQKCILAGDLIPKHPSCNIAFSNPSGDKLLQLFDTDDLEVSARQCPTHYSAVGNGDVLDIMLRKNMKISNVIVHDILDLDHLPILFYILDHVRTNKVLEPFGKVTD
jgi:hypothetical protein